MPRAPWSSWAAAVARKKGLADRITFVEANVCATGLPDGSFDFVWGEDAWCYVEDKTKLIAEAARLLKPGGTIAFTDWMEGPVTMSGGGGGAVSGVHEIPDRAGPGRIQFVAGSQRLHRARGARYRPLSEIRRRCIST